MVDIAKPHRARRIVLGAVLGAVIAIAAVLGLHFASIIRIPFLPTSSEIALGLTLGRVAGDGEFEVAVDADLTVAIEADGTSSEDQLELTVGVEGTGSVRNFGLADPLLSKVEDGELTVRAGASDANGWSAPSDLEAVATFEADLADGIVDYVLEHPFQVAGSQKIDVDSLRNSSDGTIEIKNLRVDGNTAKLTVDGESIMRSDAFDDAERALRKAGFARSLSVDDVPVTVVVDEAGDRISVSLDVSAEVEAEDAAAEDAVRAVFSLGDAVSVLAGTDAFEATLDGTLRSSLEVQVLGHPVPVEIVASIDGSCLASGFAIDDLSALEVDDGRLGIAFAWGEIFAGIAPDLNMDLELEFEADLGKGTLSYSMSKPVKASGDVPIDAGGPAFAPSGGAGAAGGVVIRNVNATADGLSFTIRGKDLTEGGPLAGSLSEVAAAAGASSIELGDVKVSVSVDPGAGEVAVAIDFPASIGGLALPDPINADVDLDAAASLELTLVAS